MDNELSQASASLDRLFSVSVGGGVTYIHPHIFFDGEGTAFIFYTPDSHTCKITTDRNFSDWYGYISTGEEERFARFLPLVCERYGVEWDEASFTLSITFRRNKYTLAQALMRLTGAMLFLSEL